MMFPPGRELYKWSKAEVAKADFPTDEVSTVKGANFDSFSLVAPANLTVYGGEDLSSFYCKTVDQQHGGSGYAFASFESGTSTGMITTSTWAKLNTSYYITATSISGSIYANFADSSNTQVGFYSGTWEGANVQQANGYFWWSS